MMHKHILYLASGNSRRFGSNKLLYRLDGKPIYLWGLETLWQLVQTQDNCTLTVVSRYEAIRETARKMGIQAIDSPDSEKGISYTIRAGLRAITPEPEDYILFAAADQPYLTAESISRLLSLAGKNVECASLCYGERPGNPTLFSARLIPELEVLEGDTGGRAVLRRHNCVFVSVASSKELEDIDLPY